MTALPSRLGCRICGFELHQHDRVVPDTAAARDMFGEERPVVHGVCAEFAGEAPPELLARLVKAERAQTERRLAARERKRKSRAAKAAADAVTVTVTRTVNTPA